MRRLILLGAIAALVLAGCPGGGGGGNERPGAITMTAADGGFPHRFLGYPQGLIPRMEITVSNTGTAASGDLAATIAGAGASNFDIDGGAVGVLAAGETATFHVFPIHGLNIGIYTATVTLVGAGAPISLDLTFEVRPPPAHGIELGVSGGSVGQYRFRALGSDYLADEIVPLTVTVYNIGTQATGPMFVELSGRDSAEFTSTAASLSSLAVGGEVEFQVSPRLGLTYGEFIARLTVSGNNFVEEPRHIDMTLDVVHDQIITNFFTDAVFRDVVRILLGIEDGAPIRQSHVRDVVRLEFSTPSGINVTSLNGIEFFENLEVLSARHNHIAAVDFSGNPRLRVVDLYHNNIAVFDARGMQALEELNLGWVNLPAVPMHTLHFDEVHPNLTFLNIDHAQVVDLNLAALPALEMLAVNFVQTLRGGILDVTNNPRLTGLAASRMGLNSLDLRQNPLLEILDINENNLSGDIDFGYNPELRYLSFGAVVFAGIGENVTDLDFSRNTRLESLSIGNLGFTELDLSGNLELDNVVIGGNENMHTVSLPSPNNIRNLTIRGMQGRSVLSSFDLDGAQLLSSLNLTNNAITSVRIVNNPMLTSLNLSGNNLRYETDVVLDNNPRLTSIDFAANRLTSFSTERLPETLTVLSFHANELETLTLDRQTNLTLLNLTSSPMPAPEGHPEGTPLPHNNRLKTLDLSNNVRLIDVLLSGNELEGHFDVSMLPNLGRLWLGDNNLTSIDISNTRLGIRPWLEENFIVRLEAHGNRLASPDAITGWRDLPLTLGWTLRFLPQQPGAAGHVDGLPPAVAPTPASMAAEGPNFLPATLAPRITVPADGTITAQVGVPFAYRFTADSWWPLDWQVAEWPGERLPELILEDTGLLFGTPRAPGTYTFRVSANVVRLAESPTAAGNLGPGNNIAGMYSEAYFTLVIE